MNHTVSIIVPIAYNITMAIVRGINNMTDDEVKHIITQINEDEILYGMPVPYKAAAMLVIGAMHGAVRINHPNCFITVICQAIALFMWTHGADASAIREATGVDVSTFQSSNDDHSDDTAPWD